MTAIIVPPQRFTVSSASQQTTAPATNLLNDAPGMVWRSTDLAGPNITVATSGLPFDTIALVGGNLGPTDTLHIQGAGNAAMTNPLFQRDIPAYTGIAGKSGSTSILLLEMPTSCAFVRLDIASPNNSAGYVQAGRLVIGQRITMRGIDVGSERGWQDGSTVEEALGSTIFDPQRSRDTWKVTVSNVSQADTWGKWDPFFAQVGKHRAFLFVPDLTSAFLQNQCCLGRVTSDVKASLVSSDLSALQINIMQV